MPAPEYTQSTVMTPARLEEEDVVVALDTDDHDESTVFAYGANRVDGGFQLISMPPQLNQRPIKEDS